jgi:uncharacterized protein YceH (UPF0502 family)
MLDKLDIAILAELLLRGPQTLGELRTRASRMEPMDDLDTLRNALRPLVGRNLVVWLTPEDRRGAMVTHGFHDPRELEHLRARQAAEPAALPTPAPVASPRIEQPPAAVSESGRDEAGAEIAALKDLVFRLREELSALRDEVRDLKQSLGA